MSRLRRIREKLDGLRAWDPACEAFGAERHRYRLNPPSSLDRVRAFEAEFGAELPPDYVAFLTELGDGGAGPGYGLHTLDRIADELRTIEREYSLDGGPVRRLNDPFPFTAEHTRLFDGHWRETLGLAPPDGDVWNIAGAFMICEYGCAHDGYLAVTGDLRGSVWCTDGYTFRPWTGEPGRLDFLSWYEAWLDEWLAPGALERWAAPLRSKRPGPPPQVYVVEGTRDGVEIRNLRPGNNHERTGST